MAHSYIRNQHILLALAALLRLLNYSTFTINMPSFSGNFYALVSKFLSCPILFVKFNVQLIKIFQKGISSACLLMLSLCFLKKEISNLHLKFMSNSPVFRFTIYLITIFYLQSLALMKLGETTSNYKQICKDDLLILIKVILIHKAQTSN